VERVDLPPLTRARQQGALVSPVDLGLGPRDGLEPPMQRRWPLVRIALELEAHPGVADVVLDPLVVPGEAIIRDQPLVDHRRPKPRFLAQPAVDHPDERVHQPRLRALPRRRPRRAGRRVRRQILPGSAPVAAGLGRDLFPRRPARA